MGLFDFFSNPRLLQGAATPAGVAPSADNEQVTQDMLALGRGLSAGGAYFLPGAGVAEYAGLAPQMSGPGFAPGFSETDSWLDKGLLTLGAAGDAAYAVPGIGLAAGTILKAPRAAQKALTAGKELALGTPDKPIWDMSLPELKSARKAEEEYYSGIEERLMGPETAKRYNVLYRRADSQNPDTADSAIAELHALEDEVGDDVMDQIYGVGRTNPAPDEYKALEKAIEDVDFDAETAEELGRNLRWAITNIGQATDPAKMTGTELQAYVSLRRGAEISAEMGFDTKDVMKAALEGSATRFTDPADAEFMLRRFLNPTAGTILKAPTNIGDTLTDIDVPEITIARPAYVDVDPRIGTTGNYRGAPKGVDSPQKLGAMRNNLRQSLERGVIGKDWYQKSSDTARLLTAGRPGYKKLYTGSTALTSTSAKVKANQPWGVKGYNQYITGAPFNTGRFPSQPREQLGLLRAGQPIELGPKVGPFYEALNVSPGVAASRPTNDIWMARAFDYRKPDGGVWDAALGEAQHRFIDKEMESLTKWANQNKVGGYDDWTPEQVQASIWVDTKARAENTSVEEAAQDFSDNLDRMTAGINVESAPAGDLDHLSGVVDDENVGGLLASRQREALTNKEGQDVIASQAGALTLPSIPGPGYYKGSSDPAEAIRILVGTETGSPVMDSASMELAKGIGATRGLLQAQESVGINFVKPGGSVSERNAAILDLDGPPTSEKMIEVGQKLDEAFDGNVIPVHTGEGLNYLAFWGDEGAEGSLRAWGSKNNIDLSGADDVVEKRLAEAWQKELTKISKDTLGKKPTYGIKTSELVGSFDGYKPSAYLEEIERLNPQTRAALDSEPIRLAARELENIDMKLIKEFPNAGQRSQIVQTTRQALIEGGFARVRELVDAGVLPAVMVGLVGGGLAASLSSPQANGQTSAPLLPKGRGDLYY